MSNKIASIKKARERQQAKEGMIPATLGQILGSLGQNPFIRTPSALGILVNESLPIRASFLIGKIMKAINAEFEQYQASHKLLCERYAKKDADGKPIIIGEDGKPIVEGEPGRYDIPADQSAAFNKELAELMGMEVSIPGQQIKASELGDVRIAPAHLMNLDWLFQD